MNDDFDVDNIVLVEQVHIIQALEVNMELWVDVDFTVLKIFGVIFIILIKDDKMKNSLQDVRITVELLDSSEIVNVDIVTHGIFPFFGKQQVGNNYRYVQELEIPILILNYVISS